MKRVAFVRKCKPGQMPVNNPARLHASSLDKDTPLSVTIVQPLIDHGRFKDADCASSWHRFIRCARQTDGEIVMSRFVLSSPSNSALLSSLRVAPCELLLRVTPLTVTFVHARKGLPTFYRRACADCLPRLGGSESGRQSYRKQLRD